MAKKAKTRLDELWDAEIDYSMPIHAFAKKARTLFNRMAKDAGLKTKVFAGEYSDGSARLYLETGHDSLGAVAGVLSVFALNVQLLASENARLTKLELPVTSVTFGGDEICVNF